MVLFGGLEILAAGYVYHKHKENKQERLRAEEEAETLREQEARRRRRKHSHKSKSHAPPQYEQHVHHHKADATAQASVPIPHSYIPSTLQPHHTAQYYPHSAYPTEPFLPPLSSQRQTEHHEISRYLEVDHPSMAELSSEPYSRNNKPPSILRPSSRERQRLSEDDTPASPHVHFALPPQSPSEELHATTPPPPYLP